MKIEIIERNTLREAIKEMLEKRIRPLTVEKIWKLRKEGKLENKWYNTGTLWHEGKLQRITFRQMKDIKKIYNKGGRLLCMDDGDGGGLGGFIDLDDDAHFVGVRENVKRKK